MSQPSPRKKSSSRSAKTSWIRRAVAGIFGKVTGRRPSAQTPIGAAPLALTKAETSLLPTFPALPLERIHVPHTEAECRAAARKILAAKVAGFDTEAKPTFRPGEKSTGPHVVQFALTNCAYVFQLHRACCQQTSAELIASEKLLKVGFGLRNDHGQIRRRLGVTLHHVLDLDHVFRRRGYRGQIGVRGAIGALLHQNFAKSKSTTTSNWAANELTPRQLLYAANDAYAALKVMEALRLPASELPDPNQPEPLPDHSPKKSGPRASRPPRRRRRSPKSSPSSES